MDVRTTLKEISGALCAVLFMTLAGCAQTPVADNADTVAPRQAVKEDSKVEKPAAASMAPGEEIVPDYAVMNPVPIAFDKLSVKLRDSDKQLLAQIKDRAQKARKLTITGYCDRKQVGNAKAAALARANSVKDELVRLGVKPKLINVKHVTSVANKHVVEVEL